MSQQNRPPQRNNQQRPNPQQGQQPYNPRYPQYGQQPHHPQNPNQGQYPQNPNQGQYPQNPNQGAYPPQGQYPQNPNQGAYPPQGQQPYYPQNPISGSQPEKIYLEAKRNPLMMVLKVIAFPFVKLFQIIGNVFTIIFQELVRSVVSFVFGITLLIAFVALVAGYGYSLYLTNFDFAGAVPEMFRLFGSFFRFGG